MTRGTQFYSSEYTPLFFFKWPEALNFIQVNTHLYSSLNDQSTQFYSSEYTPLFFFKWPEALNFIQVNTHLYSSLNDQALNFIQVNTHFYSSLNDRGTQFYSSEYTPLFFFKWPEHSILFKWIHTFILL